VIKDNINWRRHRTACPNYREDWKVEDGLYRCICLQNTPPETRGEQELCMKSRHGCWRDNPTSKLHARAEAFAGARAARPDPLDDPDDDPLESP
jgi:hypothetical protein